MGMPIRTLTDVLRNIDVIQNSMHPKAFAFVLYKKEHKEFRKYILENFDRLHSISRETVLFVLDKPKQWLTRQDIPYYRETMGENYTPDHDDIEVKIAAKYFEIPEEQLPAVVLFNSLKTAEWTTISLRDTNLEKYDNVFQQLFKYLNKYSSIFERHESLAKLKKREKDQNNISGTEPDSKGLNSDSILYSRILNPFPDKRVPFFRDVFTTHLKLLREIFETINFKTVSKSQNDENIKQMLDKIHEEVKHARKENRDYFNQINEKLTQIQKDLKDYKSNLKQNLNKVENQNELPLAAMQYEELLHEYDETLLNSVGTITKESKSEVNTEILKLTFLENYEPETLEMIRSGLNVYKLAVNYKDDSFDYSLAAVGLWKAVEKELNIILIDVLRLIRNFISAIPSYGIAHNPGRCEIFAGYKKGEKYNVDINRQYQNNFSPVMFGDMVRISENWKENDYKEVINKLRKEMQTVSDMNIFMNDFVDRFKKIVYDYRNACSHTEKMTETQFNEFKEILMSEKGLYYQISELKRNIYKVFIKEKVSLK